MFNTKKTALIERKKETPVKTTGAVQKASGGGTANQFLAKGMKKSAETRSGNNALKYSTTGNGFVDQFGLLGGYKAPREYNMIEKDTSTLWGLDPKMTVCFILYLRLITRVVSLFEGSKTSSVQRGAGLKHEAIMRMMWLHINHKDVFWKNVGLFIAAGSWKDIFVMLSLDLQYNGWKGRVLDWDKMKKLILAGLENPNTSELIKKYLPQIRSTSVCRTVEAQADNIIAKWIMSSLYTPTGEEDFKGYKIYRKLKSSGTAHTWQQLISQKKMLDINFNSIHGRALSQLVSGKFLANQGLEKLYEAWISSKPVAKYTGYPPELFMKIPAKQYQIETINKQFLGLVETAKSGAKKGTSLIVVRDTSGSMRAPATGIAMPAGDIAKALALFFSYMLPEGRFANSWIEFASTAVMHTWKGSTPMEKWRNDSSEYYGSTNFQSVIDLFCHIKVVDKVVESEFPTGILCISDGEFNPTELGKTNVETALKKLRKAGFTEDYVSNFKIVLWNVRSSAYGGNAGNKFETYGNVPNVFYFSGYDGSVVAFLTGMETKEGEEEKATPKTAEELFQAAMDQELLKLVEI